MVNAADLYKLTPEQRKALLDDLRVIEEGGFASGHPAITQMAADISKLADENHSSAERVVEALCRALNLPAPFGSKAKSGKEGSAGTARKLSRRNAIIRELKAAGLSGWTPNTSTSDLEEMYFKQFGQEKFNEITKQYPAPKLAK